MAQKATGGYIIVKEQRLDGSVVALSGARKTHNPQWVEHRELQDCYVHSWKYIKRAVRRKVAWVPEATQAIAAALDPGDGPGKDRAVVDGDQNPYWFGEILQEITRSATA